MSEEKDLKSPINGGELTEFGQGLFSQMDTVAGHRGYTDPQPAPPPTTETLRKDQDLEREGDEAFGNFIGKASAEVEEESVCAEADRIVANDRNDFYGHPFDNYTRIAGAAEALKIDVYTPEGSILFMVLTKVAREVYRPKRDNRVDMAGYAKALDMLHQERDRRG